MGIERTTAYPARYANTAILTEPTRCVKPIRTFCFHFDVIRVRAKRNAPVLRMQEQRDLAVLIGRSTGVKPEYQRRERFYAIGDWMVSDGSVVSEAFDIEGMERTLQVLNELGDAGWRPDGEFLICYRPETYDRRMVLNLYNIIEARNRLITQALGLPSELQIIIDRELVLGVPLNTFSFEVIEACVILLRQAALQSCSVGKARMQPCDMTNPKYQMRTWLLRLGFIGDEFSRPRQTLLHNLPGDGAFFDETSKEKAAAKRKVHNAAR